MFALYFSSFHLYLNRYFISLYFFKEIDFDTFTAKPKVRKMTFAPKPDLLKLWFYDVGTHPSWANDTFSSPSHSWRENCVDVSEPWNQSDSPRSASPTSYPHPGRPRLTSSPDISLVTQTPNLHNEPCRKGREERRQFPSPPFSPPPFDFYVKFSQVQLWNTLENNFVNKLPFTLDHYFSKTVISE